MHAFDHNEKTLASAATPPPRAPNMSTFRATLLRGAGLVCLSICAAAQGSWIRQSPVPYGELGASGWAGASSAAFSASRGFIVGSGLLETTDGGWTWQRRQIGVPEHLFSGITFFGPQHGWLSGNSLGFGPAGNENFRTLDGGATWLPMNLPGSDYRFIDFVSTTHGWAGGMTVLFETQDGGVTWSLENLPTQPTQFTGRFDFFDDSLGLLSDSGIIWRTTNGGANWTPVYSALAATIVFLDANTVLLARDSQSGLPDFARSDDAGMTWYDIDVPGVILWNPVRVDANTLMASSGGYDGNDLYRSTDKGLTWTYVKEGNWYPINGGAFLDSQNGIAFANGQQILRTQDGGSSWLQVSSGMVTQLEDIEMLDDSRGLAAGYDGTVFVTQNGGTQWTPVRCGFELSFGDTFEAVTTAPPNFMLAAGLSGTTVKSLDGGVTWQGVNAPGDHWAAKFLTADEGWIAGGSQAIRHTVDGGLSWTLQHQVVGSGEAVYDIEFTDALNGWAVGTFHGVLITNDGGALWTMHDFGTGFPFCRKVDMIDANQGWVSSRADFIAHTTNGGLTWTHQPVPQSTDPQNPEQYIFSLSAVSAIECWAATSQGRVFHTTDAGANWTVVDNGFHNLFDNWFAMDARSNGNVWLAGERGRIVRRLGTRPEAGTSYCFGDAGSAVCPCGNASAAGSQGGCLNSQGTAGKLMATGSAHLFGDSLALVATQLPPTAPVVFLQGTAAQPGGGGLVMGDGLLCVSGTVLRLGTRFCSAGAASYPGDGSGSVSVQGVVSAPGLRRYQAWYRDAANFCSTGTFNLTSGYQVLWTP